MAVRLSALFGLALDSAPPFTYTSNPGTTCGVTQFSALGLALPLTTPVGPGVTVTLSDPNIIAASVPTSYMLFSGATALFGSNTAVAASNLVFGGGDVGERMAFSSNASVWASNTSKFSSNSVGVSSGIAAFGSNTGAWGSNKAAWGSNASTWGSNASFFGSNTAVIGCNAAIFGSNTATTACNAAVFASNAGAWGSNTGSFGYKASEFGSNASVMASNTAVMGSNTAVSASNTAVSASNKAVTGCNVAMATSNALFGWTGTSNTAAAAKTTSLFASNTGVYSCNTGTSASNRAFAAVSSITNSNIFFSSNAAILPGDVNVLGVLNVATTLNVKGLPVGFWGCNTAWAASNWAFSTVPTITSSNVYFSSNSSVYPSDLNVYRTLHAGAACTTMLDMLSLDVVNFAAVSADMAVPMNTATGVASNNYPQARLLCALGQAAVSNVSSDPLMVSVRGVQFRDSRAGLNDTGLEWYVKNNVTGVSSPNVTGYTTTIPMYIDIGDSFSVMQAASTGDNTWYSTNATTFMVTSRPTVALSTSAGGFVGVCMGNPKYPLDVSGVLNVSSNVIVAGQLLDGLFNGTSTVSVNSITASGLVQANFKVQFSAVGSAPPSLGVSGGSGDKVILHPGGPGYHPYSLGVAGGTLWASVPAGATHVWYIGGVERMRVSGNGYIGIGTTSPSAPVHVNGYSSINGNSVSILASHDISAFSDARLKTNLVVIDDALEKVKMISGYTFNRVDNPHGKRQCGVIAQEIHNILPEVVQTQDDGMMSVSYANIVALLIEAIKKQDTQVQGLKTELAVVNSRLATLEDIT